MASFDSQFQPAAGISIRTGHQKYPIVTSVALALLALSILVAPVLGQALPGRPDTSFDAGSIASSSTSFGVAPLARIVVQPDQRILIADTLSLSMGLWGTTLFRLNTDGTQDSGFSSSGYGLCGMDRIGRIFSLGSTGLVRLNSDGTIDPSFGPVPLVDYFPLAAELSDGRIVAAVLRQVNPRTQVETLERLSSGGVVDPGYVIQIATGTFYAIYNAVSALVTTSDGGVVLAGSIGLQAFDANGQEVVRLRGFGTSPVSSAVWTLAIQPDGKVLAGGDYGTTLGPIFRLNTDYSLDTSFAPQVDNLYRDTAVYTIAVEPSGKILIGGNFRSIGGQPRKGIARLNGDGSLDESFDPGTGVTQPTFIPNYDVGAVMAAAIQLDGNILIGGTFQFVDGVGRTNLARLLGGEIPGPPRVQIPPSDRVLVPGAPLALQGWFSGSPAPAYQWLCNGAAIVGATNSSLSIASTDLSRAGAYQVAASNSLGAITSVVAQVSILMPVSNPIVSNAVFQATVGTKTNRTYAAEFTDSLETPFWSPLRSFPGTGADQVFQDTSGPKAQRFYRVRAW